MTSTLTTVRWTTTALALCGLNAIALAQNTTTRWSGTRQTATDTTSTRSRYNSAPVISGTPAASITAGSLYDFAPTASDPEGRSLRFSIRNRPAWASFSSTTGQLRGTPQASHVGTYSNIAISVSDGRKTAALAPFSITVKASASISNVAPIISGAPATSVQVGADYRFTPTASDANSDPLTFTIANRPAWATFNANTGALTGTPSSGSVGTYGNIVIGVSDGVASRSLPAFAVAVTAAANAAPTIGGTPATSILPGSAYAFQPTAVDADGDPLTFSIANQPAWTTFSANTGALQGTPGAADVGTTNGIVITVTDGTTSASLPAFSIAVQATATASATLSWQPPTQNQDGSPLSNLAGFKVYWGTAQGTYPNSVTLSNPGLATYVVENLVAGTYHFVVTAVSSTGIESAYSNSASKIIR